MTAPRLPGYRAPWWLPGGHLQTLHPYFFTPPLAVPYRRRRWDTPDGDFIDLDWLDGPSAGPLLVLFHGLEGSSRSHYARSLMAALAARGWRGVVPHFRGCGGEPNRLARAYHSGDSAEIDWVLRRLSAENAGRVLYAAGFSLGGNALLKWLGEQGEAARPLLAGAAAISAPLDLNAAGATLDRGASRLIYTREFLRTLKPKVLRKLARHPGLCRREALHAAATLRRFDDLYTAPAHGFADAADYWSRASSRPWLGAIRVPTLLLNARNDPFLPAAALPDANQASPAVTAEFPAQGGHAGFPSRPRFGGLPWLPARILEFLEGASAA